MAVCDLFATGFSHATCPTLGAGLSVLGIVNNGTANSNLTATRSQWLGNSLFAANAFSTTGRNNDGGAGVMVCVCDQSLGC